ncbi:MAG: sulfatase [Candidatus Brocadiia bacterium]
MPETPPNILLLCSDQQHASTLGVTNDRIRTPALDRLCCEGVRFDRAYCTNPTCTPCRASMLTGLYPSQHGAWSLGTKLFEHVPVVGDLFAHAGYVTALIGKAHLQPLASRPGMESLECQPTLRDLDFWRRFHGPWYGFQHVEVARNHAWESHAGQHYAIWMEERGLGDWRRYFAQWPHQKDDIQRLRAMRHWDLPQEFHYTRWTGERARAFIERSHAAGRPFFAMVNFHDPHPPYAVPEPWASMYGPADMVPGQLTPGEHQRNPRHFAMTQEPSPDFRGLFFEDQGIHGGHSHLRDRDELKKDMAIYYGMVSFLDDEVGAILDTLDRLDIARDTLVLFTTDHGHFLGQHGLVAKAIHHYEDLLRVPWIVRWPGRVPEGQVSEALQNHVDLSPTFLAAAGIPVPHHMTGLDQLPAWTGGPPARCCSITENHHTRTNFHMHTYVDARYKITVYRKWDCGELFDLQEDPQEVNNLWDEPQAAELKCGLLHRFHQARMQGESLPMPRIAGA